MGEEVIGAPCSEGAQEETGDVCDSIPAPFSRSADLPGEGGVGARVAMMN